MTLGADGLPTGESPTPSAEIDVQQTATASPVGDQSANATSAASPTPPVENGSEPSKLPPRDERGRFADPKSAPDPVEAAISKLARPAPAKLAAKAEAKTTAPANAPEAPAAPTDKKAPTDTPADPDALTTDPLAGFETNERGTLKAKTHGRITDLHRRWQGAESKLKEAEPLIEAGREFTEGVIGKYQLNDDVGFVPPDHIAGLIKVQAAVNRSVLAISQGRTPPPGDLEAFKSFTAQVDQLRTRLGVQAAPVAIQPFAGQLPPDLDDLVQVYGVAEADVRLLAAIRAKAPQAATQVAPPVQAPVPQAPPTQTAPVGVDMDILYARRLSSDLVGGGVPVERVQATLQSLLSQARGEVRKMFPGIADQDIPRAFDALTAKDRYDMLLGLHRQATAKPPVSKPVPPAAPATPTRSIPSTPRPGPPAVDQDPVAAAIARLSR